MATQLESVGLITADDAARILEVSTQMVARYCRAGRLKAQRLASCWLIDEKSVREFVPNPRGRQPGYSAKPVVRSRRRARK
jgi:hypothetical protein